MPTYNFTSDLRITDLPKQIGRAAEEIIKNELNADKSASNNRATLAFYFNLIGGTNTLKLAASGNIIEVIRNFVKKFQFPNPYTDKLLKKNIEEHTLIAPLRECVKLLAYQVFTNKDKAPYLSLEEIREYIFSRPQIWIDAEVNTYESVFSEILAKRTESQSLFDIGGSNEIQLDWKQSERQSREMISVIPYACSAFKVERGKLQLNMPSPFDPSYPDVLSFISNVLNYSEFWYPDKDLPFNDIKDYYVSYMDIKGNFDFLNSFTIEIQNPLTKSKYVGDLTPVILYGPPGTGKTHSLQTDYIKEFDKSVVWFTTFHQSFSYEEFVEGLKPSLGESGDDISYNIDEGVFYQACEKAAQLAGFESLYKSVLASPEERKDKYENAVKDRRLVLLCIDEINRGNVASIFGDLISLIEPSKRLGNKEELILTLPYSKEKFGVPSNLLIVGTMNTADRSIQLLDSALRRRFEFKELLPKYSVIKNVKARNILEKINSRVRALINKDSQIGHSYFFDIPKESDKESLLILKALINKIIPLLEEYFYNDHTKVRFVLSENKDTKSSFYVKDDLATEMYEKFANDEQLEETIDFYELNPNIKKALDEEDENLADSFLKRWTESVKESNNSDI